MVSLSETEKECASRRSIKTGISLFFITAHPLINTVVHTRAAAAFIMFGIFVTNLKKHVSKLREVQEKGDDELNHALLQLKVTCGFTS